MEVKILTKDGHDGLSSDFQFLAPLVEALSNITGTSIYFPKPEGGLREAEAVCSTEWLYCNIREHNVPVGIFTFHSKKLEMKMMYQARVCQARGDGSALELTMTPVGKHISKKVWPTTTAKHVTHASMVKALSQNFGIGSMYRKIVPHAAPAPK